MKYRTFTCGELTDNEVDAKVVLSGWVHRRRDHGGVIFIDLRDRYGLTQIVSDPVDFADAHNTMDGARSEFLLKIEGTVRLRPGDNFNPNLKTGKIEVLVSNCTILNKSLTPPFEIDQDKEVGEDIRLKYRYLDLRRDRLKNNIVLRHKVIKHIRDYLDNLNFLEIETPILIKGTPEGSREYVIPSRIYPGKFYVLPQSPQQLKQLLMISGFDCYFQIARCFRDEDQRGDRQPEFTQMDLEMSFIEKEEIMAINEKLLTDLVNKFIPNKQILKTPFPVLTYEEAMNKYGSDSPDIRFDLEIVDVSSIAEKCDFGVFNSAVKDGGVVKALKVKDGASFTRKQIDELTEIAKLHGAKGLAYIVVEKDNLKSPITKYFKSEELKEIITICSAEPGDIIFFTADSFKTACESLGKVRVEIARQQNLIDDNVFAFVWVIDFPMFEYNDEIQTLDAVHHPFTAPLDLEEFKKHPETSLSNAYDIVLNGTEIGGGSIRIHNKELQLKVFKLLKLTDEDVESRFGHMLEAFDYAAPPHGGIALGLDRLLMLFSGEPNIREVIAFPKDQKAKDLMLGSPSDIPESHLEELSLRLDIDE